MAQEPIPGDTRLDGLLDAQQTARLLHVSRKFVYELANSGRLAHYRLGPLFRFAPQHIAEYLRANEEEVD